MIRVIRSRSLLLSIPHRVSRCSLSDERPARVKQKIAAVGFALTQHPTQTDASDGEDDVLFNTLSARQIQGGPVTLFGELPDALDRIDGWRPARSTVLIPNDRA